MLILRGWRRTATAFAAEHRIKQATQILILPKDNIGIEFYHTLVLRMSYFPHKIFGNNFNI